jgi:hypothetical protein
MIVESILAVVSVGLLCLVLLFVAAWCCWLVISNIRHEE